MGHAKRLGGQDIPMLGTLIRLVTRMNLRFQLLSVCVRKLSSLKGRGMGAWCRRMGFRIWLAQARTFSYPVARPSIRACGLTTASLAMGAR